MNGDVRVLRNDELTRKIVVVVGTRPGIVMLSPLIKELKKRFADTCVIHTGQHYSPNMDADFFRDLELPPPEHKLTGVSAGQTHAQQTARMLEGIESILIQERPSIVLVGGDANTNLAGALAARKLGISVGHIEAGERSYDWRMPEEHNRRMIDHISDLLFATDENSKRHLDHENVQGEIHIVGNPIVDASMDNFILANKKSKVLEKLGLKVAGYVVMTTHREENVDNRENLAGELEGVSDASQKTGLPVVFPVHPRTEKRLKEFGLWERLIRDPRMNAIEALGYLDFLRLLASSAMVFTDSGGVQQEACIHHIPAVTLRQNTEWTVTLSLGANRLAGTNPQMIVQCAEDAMGSAREWEVPFGDGHTSQRIAEIVGGKLNK